MADDDTVEIVISGSLDDSLASSADLTMEALSSLQAGASRFGTQGSAQAQLLASALQAMNAEVSKLAPDMLSIGASAQAGFGAVAAAEHGAEAESSVLHPKTLDVIKDFVDLGQEALSGNISRMPAIILGLMGDMSGLTGATLGTTLAFGAAGAAVGAFAVVVGSAIIKENEQEEAYRAMAEAAALHGRVAGGTSQKVREESENLQVLLGISQEYADAIVQQENAHGEWNEVVNRYVNQLAPAFLSANGNAKNSTKESTKQLGDMKIALTEIVTGGTDQAIAAVDELDRTYLHLAGSASESKRAIMQQILQLITSNDRMQAIKTIIVEIAEQGRARFRDLEGQIAQTRQAIGEAEKAYKSLQETNARPLSGRSGMGINAFSADVERAAQKLDGLRQNLRDLLSEAAGLKNLPTTSPAPAAGAGGVTERIDVTGAPGGGQTQGPLDVGDIQQHLATIRQNIALNDAQIAQQSEQWLQSIQHAAFASGEAQRYADQQLAESKVELAHTSAPGNYRNR